MKILRRLLAIVLLVSLAVGASACGRKAKLERGPDNEAPKEYPVE